MRANINKGKTEPVAGLTASLGAKARRRRSKYETLNEIERHALPPRNDLLPRLEVEYVPVGKMSFAERRLRDDDPTQSARIDASIGKFGVCRPILVDRNYRIIDGHMIFEAARRAGLREIPVIVIHHLSPSELRLLSITLNRIQETGSWSGEALRLEIEELIDLGEDVVLTGFDEAEIDLLLLDDEDFGTETADDLPTLTDCSTSQPDDLWVLGRHRLLQGDALAPASYERLMENHESARIVLTDEPYNVPIRGHVTSGKHHGEFAMAAGEMSPEEFLNFNHRWMQLSSDRLADGGLLATFIDWRSVDTVITAGRSLDLELLNIVVWTKTNAGQGSLWRSQHELLPVLKKGNASHVNNVDGLGAGFIDSIRDIGYRHVDGAIVTGDKRVRAEAVTPLLERGVVGILRSMPGFEMFMSEILSFPSGMNDDMVDAFTILLNRRQDVLREANRYRRPKRQHLPRATGSTVTYRLVPFDNRSHRRQTYYDRWR